MTIVFGKANAPDGRPLTSRLTAELIAPNTRAVTHSPDGTPMLPVVADAEAPAGALGSVTLPAVDAPDWRDDTGAAYSMWAYKLTEHTEGVVREKYLQPLVGQATIDFDEIPDGTVGLPVSAPSAAVTSVAGSTGAVSAEGIFAAIEGDLSAAFARRLRQRDLPTWTNRAAYLNPNPAPVSVSAHNAATAVTSPVVLDLGDPRLYVSERVYPATTGAASTTDYSGAVVTDAFKQNINVGSELLPWAIEWITDSVNIEVVYQASAAVNYLLIEDGLPHTLAPIEISNGGGGTYRLRIQPSSRKLRHFRLEVVNMFPAHLVFSRADTVYAPPVNRPRVGFVGDSYTQQGGVQGVAWAVAELMGWEPIVDGDGGSGYLAAPTFRSRLAGMLSTEPDALVICGGINDGTTGLAAEVDDYFAAIAAARPGLPVFVCGPWAPSDASRTSQAGKFATLRAAAQAHGFAFVDNFTVPWVTGTGNAGAPTGDGNGDYVTASDGTHPNGWVGRLYLATRLAQAINNSLPSL